MKATIVVDPMFGDGGKGAAVDYLSEGAHMIVRFNGGAQADHTIQVGGNRVGVGLLGSGLLREIPVFLSEHVRVDLKAIQLELEALRHCPLSYLNPHVLVDERALLVTPYHVEASQKMARSSTKGTTGMGVGESSRNAVAHPETAIHATDLSSRPTLVQKLWGQAWDYRSMLSAEKIAEDMLIAASHIRIQNWEKYLWHRGQYYVFESSGGFYIDPVEGYQPYVTSTRTTQANAVPMILSMGKLEEVSYKIVGVLPILTTRHGPGTFPTEEYRLKPFFPTHLPESTPGQGPQRVGWLDLDLAANACKKMHVDELHVTHLDYWTRLPYWKVKKDGVLQELPDNIDYLLDLIEITTGVPVTVVGYGPKREDRHERK